MTMSDLLSQILGFFIAGFETSSSALAFSLYELARNPDVQIKLQRELDEAYERHGNITYQMLQELLYMDNVISGKNCQLYVVLIGVTHTYTQLYTVKLLYTTSSRWYH